MTSYALFGQERVNLNSNMKFLSRKAFKGNQCFIGCGIYAVASNIYLVFKDNIYQYGCGISVSSTSISFNESVGNEALLEGSLVFITVTLPFLIQ